MGFTGVAGGLYIVPLYSYLQQRAPAPTRARIIGALNVVSSLFMIGGALLAMALFGVFAIKLTTFFLLFGLSGLLIGLAAMIIPNDWP